MLDKRTGVPSVSDFKYKGVQLTDSNILIFFSALNDNLHFDHVIPWDLLFYPNYRHLEKKPGFEIWMYFSFL